MSEVVQTGTAKECREDDFLLDKVYGHKKFFGNFLLGNFLGIYFFNLLKTLLYQYVMYAVQISPSPPYNNPLKSDKVRKV